MQILCTGGPGGEYGGGQLRGGQAADAERGLGTCQIIAYLQGVLGLWTYLRRG